jgi:hypothetical protein
MPFETAFAVLNGLGARNHNGLGDVKAAEGTCLGLYIAGAV